MFFDKLDKRTQEKTWTLMKQNPIKFGKLLLKEGDPITHIYFIINGQFELNKTIYFKNKEAKFRSEIDEENIQYTKYFYQRMNPKL